MTLRYITYLYLLPLGKVSVPATHRYRSLSLTLQRISV